MIWPSYFLKKFVILRLMQQKSIRYGNSTVGYLIGGQGRIPLLCFHGYGEDGGHFSFLEKYLGHQYRIIAPDLPFHGHTGWRVPEPLTEEGLWAITENILRENDCFPGGDNKISMLGFSLGGRMLLSMYGLRPALIGRVVLLAPDGLKVNFWYWFATQTIAGNRLFYITMKHPAWFFGLLRFFRLLGWVNPSVFKFVKYYIDNAPHRELLYRRWTVLRKIKPNLKQIKQQVSHYHTPFRILYGKHDRIILPSVGRRFCRSMEPDCRLSIIASGHQVLHEKHIKDILENFSG